MLLKLFFPFINGKRQENFSAYLCCKWKWSSLYGQAPALFLAFGVWAGGQNWWWYEREWFFLRCGELKDFLRAKKPWPLLGDPILMLASWYEQSCWRGQGYLQPVLLSDWHLRVDTQQLLREVPWTYKELLQPQQCSGVGPEGRSLSSNTALEQKGAGQSSVVWGSPTAFYQPLSQSPWGWSKHLLQLC